jgi:hypothetical protein
VKTCTHCHIEKEEKDFPISRIIEDKIYRKGICGVCFAQYIKTTNSYINKIQKSDYKKNRQNQSRYLKKRKDKMSESFLKENLRYYGFRENHFKHMPGIIEVYKHLTILKKTIAEHEK